MFNLIYYTDRLRCESAVSVLFDINGYGGSLQDDLENVLGDPLRYVDVGGGWGNGGIVGLLVYILMDFPNDSDRSWVIGHHFDSTV